MLFNIILFMPVFLIYAIVGTVIVHFNLSRREVEVDLSRAANVFYLYEVCKRLGEKSKGLEYLALSVICVSVLLLFFSGYLLFFSAPASL